MGKNRELRKTTVCVGMWVYEWVVYMNGWVLDT